VLQTEHEGCNVFVRKKYVVLIICVKTVAIDEDVEEGGGVKKNVKTVVGIQKSFANSNK
jgi:hypothetical protein